MNKETIDFAVFLTGHDEETIEQMYRDWKNPKSESDNWFDEFLKTENNE